MTGRCSTTVAACALAGCVVVPHTVTTYDPQCQVVARQMVLQAQQLAGFVGCRGGADCAALLVAAGVVGATSAVISGTIAVVGNVVYWFEKQGQCRAPAPPSSAASAP